jgi:hypothetical protein
VGLGWFECDNKGTGPNSEGSGLVAEIGEGGVVEIGLAEVGAGPNIGGV